MMFIVAEKMRFQFLLESVQSQAAVGQVRTMGSNLYENDVWLTSAKRLAHFIHSESELAISSPYSQAAWLGMMHSIQDYNGDSFFNLKLNFIQFVPIYI